MTNRCLDHFRGLFGDGLEIQEIFSTSASSWKKIKNVMKILLSTDCEDFIIKKTIR